MELRIDRFTGGDSPDDGPVSEHVSMGIKPRTDCVKPIESPPEVPDTMEREPRSPTRRTVLGSIAGVAAATLAGPAATRASAQSEEGPVEVALVDYAFDPGTDAPLIVPPGTTIRFVWRTGGHNIRVDQQPSESDWEGHEAIEGVGFTHEHTFETTGDYHVVCDPHESLGMIGDISVVEGESVHVQSGREWSPPGGDIGIAFIATVVGFIGLSVLGVFAGESYASIRNRTDGPSSAYTIGVAVAALGLAALVAIIVRLLLAA